MSEPLDIELELPREPAAAAQARGIVRDRCAERLEGELLTDAELLVSELVTNALRHGHGRMLMRLALDEARLLVEVVDEGSGFERDLRRRDFDDVGGRGLAIVEAAASRWGVHEGTTHVWFELELPGPRLGEPGD